MKKLLLFLCTGITAAIFILLSCQTASAIPAFARKYQTSCMTCHAPYPRLNAVGQSFRLNGYRFPDDELYVKDKPVSMGAEAYKKMFPESIWPSDIPGLPPLAVVVNNAVNYNFSGPDKKKLTFDLPTDASLVGAGTMGDNVSFFAEFAVDNSDNSSQVNAWLMYHSLGGEVIGDNHLNIKAGTIGNREIGMPNALNDDKITNEDYLYQTALNIDSHPGVELNGFGKIWRYNLGVVDAGGTSENKKDYYAALSFKFFGLGYDGSGSGADSGSGSAGQGQGVLASSSTGYWRDDSIHVGTFAYRTYEGDDAKKYDRVGGDIRVNYADASLVGGYAWGKNRELSFDDHSPIQHIWFGEADYFFLPWVIGYCRFESLSVHHTDNTDESYSDRNRVIPGVVFLIRANIKATIESEIYTKDKFATENGNDKDFYDSLSCNINWAF